MMSDPAAPQATENANLARAANARGLAAMQRGDHSAAKAEFALAAEADPSAGPLWRNLAHACRELGDIAGERAALSRALSLDRRDVAALLRSAELHERLGEEAEAVSAWSGVLQLTAGVNPPAGMKDALAHGRAYLAKAQERLAACVDADLSDTIASIEGVARRRVNAFVDGAIGRRRFYTNECAGLFYPFLPADEFFDESHFPWFGALEAKTPVIKEELQALISQGGSSLRPYVRFEEGTPESKWSPLDGSLDWSACFLWEYGQGNSTVLDRCPATAEALSIVPLTNIPGRAPNVFFSLLRPRTSIPPHTGVSNTRAIIHLPLIVPNDCGFRVGGEVRTWKEGKCLAFDDTIEHEAWNNSDELRAVLIFDVWNPYLSEQEREVIARYYRAADSTGLNRETLANR